MLICTIGDLLLDVISRPAATPAHDGDTPGRTRACPGGQAGNVAAWAVELGARGRVLCKRADDVAGALLTEELARHGVEVCGPVVSGRSGVVVSLVTGDGCRSMVSDRGVGPELSPGELEERWLDGCDVLHVSGYSLLREPIASAARAAARLAPRVSVDLSSAADIHAFGTDRFFALLHDLRPDLIFGNEQERAAITGDIDAEWVVKRGVGGARFPEGDLPAEPVDDVIDTTGAGDALAAGYLVGGPAVALEAAARCVARVGAVPW